MRRNLHGGAQEEVFTRIKEYLTRPPVLRAPVIGKAFRLYVAAQEKVIGDVLTQKDGGKEFTVAYVSRHLLDVETRYVFIERFCLSLYYACSRFRHYLLSSSCTVACQHDVMKYMMQKPILSGRIGKWIFSLVEYDLCYEPLTAMRGLIVADFIVDHSIDTDDENYVVVHPWELFFDESVCANGCGVGCLVVSPVGVKQELSTWLEFGCMNNQAEYEALVFGLEFLADVGARDVAAFGDSNLVVQQMKGESQCLDGTLHSYQKRCVKLAECFDTFQIEHISRADNE
jgi:ribonuclease HI